MSNKRTSCEGSLVGSELETTVRRLVVALETSLAAGVADAVLEVVVALAAVEAVEAAAVVVRNAL